MIGLEHVAAFFERITSVSKDKLKGSLNYLAPRTVSSSSFCHFSDMSVIKTDKANSIEMFNPCSASMMKMTKEVCTVSVLQYFPVLRRAWGFPISQYAWHLKPVY